MMIVTCGSCGLWATPHGTYVVINVIKNSVNY